MDGSPHAKAVASPHRHPFQLALGWSLLALALPLCVWSWLSPFPALGPPRTMSMLATVVDLLVVMAASLIFITGFRAMPSERFGRVVTLGLLFLGVTEWELLRLVVLRQTAAFDGPIALPPELFGLVAVALAMLSVWVYVRQDAVRWVNHQSKAALMVGVAVLGLGLLYASVVSPQWGRAWAGLGPGQQTAAYSLLCGTGVAVGLLTLHALWRRREAMVRECLMALGFSVAMALVYVTLMWAALVQGQHGGDWLADLYRFIAYLYLFHAIANEAQARPMERVNAQLQRERLVIGASPDGVLWVNQQGEILLANTAMETMSGYTGGELVGQHVEIFLPVHMRDQHRDSIRGYFTQPHARAMGMLDLSLMRRDGSKLPVDISLGHWQEEGQQYAIAYIRDLSERKRFEESLRHQATHDELTGLPNRFLFRLQLAQALASARRESRGLAVLLLDLDDFKTINDSFGHMAGDEMLRQVSARLRALLRKNDVLARLGGDEFAVLLPNLNGPDEAIGVAEKLLSSADAPYHLQGQELHTAVSIGLAFSPTDAADGDGLLRYADMAMYQAKQAGRGTYSCYSAQLDQRAQENMQMHIRLKDAIHLQKLALYYQPQVDVQTGRVVGAEALLRWNDEVLGAVSPARFVPVAETTGLILPLSAWVLETACRQIAQWDKAGTPLRVAVNFSAQQFRQQDLSEGVALSLARAGARAELLEIEITESVAMAQPVLARSQLDALVALGCSVALDDFGTGYSSLAYLKALPVAKLKIDREFVKDIPDDANDLKITKSIIALAHSLDLTLVAEGVESVRQLEFLRAYGCETYQGWLHSPAITAEEMTLVLRDQSW